MNKIIRYCLSITLLFLTCTMSAQVSRGEYWLNTDPGVGKATAFAVSGDPVSLDVPTANLAYGWNVVGVRVKNKKWSQTYIHRFFKVSPQAGSGTLSGAEYWIDSDPGMGKATTLSYATGQTDFNIDLPTASLATGIHTVGVRVRYGDKWSQTYTHCFFILSPLAGTELNAAEYWLDTDPGHGKAIAIKVSKGQQEFSLDVATAQLEVGNHTIGVRVRYGDKWSQTYTHRFVRIDPQQYSTIKIDSIQAYWDDEVDKPIHIAFTQHGDSVVVNNYDFSTNHLSYGLHYLNLHAKGNGKWSVITRYEVCKGAIPKFSILNTDICVGEEFIIQDESSEVQANTTYSWDMNGDGKAEYTTPGNITHIFNQAGKQTITLTLQTGDGCETTYSQEVFVNAKTNPSVSLKSSANKICEGESVTFTATANNAGGSPAYIWYLNDIEIAGQSNDTLALDNLKDKDVVYVKVLSSNLCADKNEAVSSKLTTTVSVAPQITLNFKDTYYVDDNAFTLASLATPTGGTFYINGVQTTSFNPSKNEVGQYVVQYVVKNSSGCESIEETTFMLLNHERATITAESSDSQMGKVTGGGQYDIGAQVTLTATANTGYHFHQWNDGVIDSIRTIVVSGDMTYTAYFAPNMYLVVFLDYDEKAILCSDRLYYGSMPFCADPTREDDDKYTYKFDKWVPEISPVVGPATYIATYTATLKIYDAIHNISENSTSRVVKIIENGNVLIVLPNGRRYNLLGVEVK